MARAGPRVSARAGAGYGMFFSCQLAPLLAQHRLEVVLQDFESPPRPISIVYPHARLLPARTRAFIEFLRTDVAQFQTGSASHAQLTRCG